MKKKEEAKYLDKEWQEMIVRLAGFLESGDQEELHQFRVQIKKLRAMLYLFEHASRQHGLQKEFKPVRKIFKHAGQIRDAYTNLQLSARYALKNKAFEASQQKIIEEEISEFRDNAKKYIKSVNDAYKQIKKQLPHIDNNLISEFYDKQLAQIAAGLETLKFNEDMHNNRKLIKILMYNRKIAEKALDGPFLYNTTYLDRLQSSMGDWHDNVVTAELFASPEVNDRPVAALIKRKNNGIKRRIRSLAIDFMKKATTVELQQ